MKSMLSDPGFWLSMYVAGAAVTGTIVSVDKRIYCERLTGTLNYCAAGAEGLAGIIAGATWPLYGAHQALYYWKTQ